MTDHNISLRVLYIYTNKILTINTLEVSLDIVGLLPEWTCTLQIYGGCKQPSTLQLTWAKFVDIIQFLCRERNEAVTGVVYTACRSAHTGLCVRTYWRVRFGTIVQPSQCYFLADGALHRVHVRSTRWWAGTRILVSSEIIFIYQLAVTWKIKSKSIF